MKYLKYLFLISCFLFSGQVFAQDGYQVQQLSFSSAGSYGGTTGYSFTGSVGDLLAGDGQSDSYGFSGGFNFNSDDEEPPPPFCCIGIRGNVDNSPDNKTDIADLVFLVAFMFGGGESPVCFEEADIDATGEIDIADLTSMVSFMFGEGVAPSDCSTSAPAFASTGKLSTIASYVSRDGSGKTSIMIETPVSIYGLHLTLFAKDSLPFQQLIDDQFEILSYQSDGVMEIGIIDLDASSILLPGKHSLIQLDGDFELVEVMISDENHQSHYVNIVAAKGEGELPDDYTLSQSYPNPFNPSTTIDFSLPEASDVSLSVFNINGQLVTTLVDATFEAGLHHVVWDGTNASGSTVSSGMYLYRIQAGSFNATKKMVLLK